MDVAIITVGDELLSGDTENTNASWLARQLVERGVTVGRMVTVPDNASVLADTVQRCAAGFDAVIVTGGLGRTPDDVTIDGVARAFDRELVEHPLVREEVERTLAAVADEYPDLDVDVGAEATLPEDARPLLNDAGLSPGCVVDNVYVMPGIPSEMEAMFAQVAEEFSGEVRSAAFHTTEPEANLVETLREANDQFDVTVGCYPNREAGHNRLKVTGDDDQAVAAAVDWLRDRVTVSDPPA